MDDEAPPGVPEWVVTYGDMMSLLLTFFIMLVSMSEIKDEGSNRAMLDSIREAFGATMSDASGVPGDGFQTTSAMNRLTSQGMRSSGGVEQDNRQSAGSGGRWKSVQSISQGQVATIGAPVYFERFSTELTELARDNLNVLIQAMAGKPNRIVVRGHASAEPLPPDSPWLDPLELSFARAEQVADYLMSRGIPRERVIVSGVGNSEPHVISPDQSLNRRAEIFIADSFVPRQLGTGPTEAEIELPETGQ
ncbi:MAG: OmpA family protein [Planctomycetaceae bacterium]|nr:OmpA family protein [Planctomycetaceae bacterium]